MKLHVEELGPETVSPPAYAPRAARKNLLLAATIESGALQAPVRVRNLSITGAMLEGAVLPDPGTRLTLRRSDIAMGATVVWRLLGRCGIKFDEAAATVDEWVAGTRAPSFNNTQGQARVDAIQNAVRSGAALPSEPVVTAAGGPSPTEIRQRVAEELVTVRLLLDGLAEEIAADPEILQRHIRSLQNLDRSTQILEHLGEVLSASDSAAAADAVKMQDLRYRLLRK